MLSNLLGNWLKKTSTNDEKAKISNLPKHEQAKIAVQSIASRKGKPFNALRASSVRMQSITPNVIELIERLNYYSAKIDDGTGLVQSDAFSEFKNITLDEFFTNAEGNYISINKWGEFITSCEKLFTVIERAIARKDQNISFSIRLLSKCIASIQNVCKAAEEAA